jgi:hypothetical protein
MTQPLVPPVLQGQFPLTAPDIYTPFASGTFASDMDVLATETTSEMQNIQQDLGHRLIELPGSNLDFGDNNTRGIGIMQYLSADGARLEGLPRKIDEEFGQDPRVVDSSTELLDNGDGTFTINTLITTQAGVFGLGYVWSQQGLVPLFVNPAST